MKAGMNKQTGIVGAGVVVIGGLITWAVKAYKSRDKAPTAKPAEAKKEGTKEKTA